MKNNQDKVQQIVFDLLDKMYSKAVKASSHYGYKQIHISVIKEFVRLSKLNNELKIPPEFITTFNNVMDALVRTVEKNATADGQISKSVFKGYIKLIKKSFVEGRNVK